ncbi:MAG: NEW3 domain-containing protein, partial [Phycisphaerae bacterium]|nr:NEW3 domain-containing protein [Phycisphaerae bacterium]
VERVDLWGNREKVKTAAPGDGDDPDSPQTVTAGKLPFFLDGTDPRLARLRASVKMDPPFVPSTYRKHTRRVRFTNTFTTPVSGKMTLHFPANWEVHPRIIPFSVQAGETFSRDIDIRFPYNAEAGTKLLTIDFALDAERAYRVQMSTKFEFGLGDVDVTTLTQWLPDDELLVTMNVTNRSDARLDLFCFVVAPDLPRQERVIAGLPPAGAAAKSFRIPAARGLVGKSIRVGLREVRGNRIVNYDVPIK